MRQACGCARCAHLCSSCVCCSWSFHSLSFSMHAGCSEIWLPACRWSMFYDALIKSDGRQSLYASACEISLQGALAAGNWRRAVRMLRGATRVTLMRTLAHLGRHPRWYAHVLSLMDAKITNPAFVVSLPDLALRQNSRSARLLFSHAATCAATWRQLASVGAFPRFERVERPHCMFTRNIMIRLMPAYQAEFVEEAVSYARGLGHYIFDSQVPLGSATRCAHSRYDDMSIPYRGSS